MTNEEMLAQLQGMMDAQDRRLDGRISALEQRQDEKFSALDERFSAMEQRVDEKFSEMDGKLSAMEQRWDGKLSALEQRVDEKLETQTVKIQLLLENEVAQKISSIYDKLDGISERLDRTPTAEDMEITNGRIDVLESIVKKLSRDVAELKKAN